jgi:hypothetical protein
LASVPEVYLRVTIKTYVRSRAFGQIWKASGTMQVLLSVQLESQEFLYKRVLKSG